MSRAVYLWIAVGAGLGGVFRFWCSGSATYLLGDAFPWGILIINALGSFVIGFFFTLTEPDGRLLVSSQIRQFVMIGLCGGYTTFSAFSLDTLNLLNAGRPLAGGLNVLLSVTLCLLFVWIGHVLALEINGPPGHRARGLQLPKRKKGKGDQ